MDKKLKLLRIQSIKKILLEVEGRLRNISLSINDLQKQLDEKLAEGEIIQLLIVKLNDTLSLGEEVAEDKS